MADTYTKKEIEVISLLKQGLTRKEIAQRMSINPDSISKYFCEIGKKCGVNGSCALIAYWATRSPIPRARVNQEEFRLIETSYRQGWRVKGIAQRHNLSEAKVKRVVKTLKDREKWAFKVITNRPYIPAFAVKNGLIKYA